MEKAEGGEKEMGSGFGSLETATTFSASEAGFDTDAMQLVELQDMQEDDEREAGRGWDGEKEKGLVTQRDEETELLEHGED